MSTVSVTVPEMTTTRRHSQGGSGRHEGVKTKSANRRLVTYRIDTAYRRFGRGHVGIVVKSPCARVRWLMWPSMDESADDSLTGTTAKRDAVNIGRESTSKIHAGMDR